MFTANPRKLEHGFRRIRARIPYFTLIKGMRRMMFQLSGFYYRLNGSAVDGLGFWDLGSFGS